MAAEALRRALPAWALQRGPWRALLLVRLAVVSWFAFARVQFNDGGLPLDKGRHLAAFAFGPCPCLALAKRFCV